MLSYKKWKKLNENVAGGSFTLGLGQRQKIAELQNRWDEMGVTMPPMKGKPMMQSKKSKKMAGCGPMGKKFMDDGGEGGDLGGGPMGGMGGPPSMKKKGKKPPFGGGGKGGPPDDMEMGPEEDELDDMGGDMGDEEEGPPEEEMGGEEDGPMGGPMDSPMGDEEDDAEADLDDADADLDDADADMDDADADLDDAEEDDDVAGMGGPDMPAPKKKGSFVDKTQAVADGAKLMHKGAKKMIKGMKESAKNEECKCAQKSKKMGASCNHKMTKEEYEFFKSLQSQTGGVRFEKDECGAWNPVKEDAILPPTDPNAGLADQEANPGEVGYAPQGRVGSFTEWAEKYQRKGRKINESVKKAKKKGSWFGQ